MRRAAKGARKTSQRRSVQIRGGLECARLKPPAKNRRVRFAFENLIRFRRINDELVSRRDVELAFLRIARGKRHQLRRPQIGKALLVLQTPAQEQSVRAR